MLVVPVVDEKDAHIDGDRGDQRRVVVTLVVKTWRRCANANEAHCGHDMDRVGGVRSDAGASYHGQVSQVSQVRHTNVSVGNTIPTMVAVAKHEMQRYPYTKRTHRSAIT